MTIYLGPPGFLQALPYMGRGIDASLDLGAVVQKALGGARTVDYVGAPKRVYQLERKFLTGDELSVLESLAYGLWTADVPMALMDPWRRNLLTPNQSTAGDVLRSTAGVLVTGSGAVIGTSGPFGPGAVPSGRYVFALTSAASGAASTCRVDFGRASISTPELLSVSSTTPGAVPVVPSLPYTFQLLINHNALTAASWQAGIYWYDYAGAFISGSLGTGALSTAAWVARTVTGTAPSTAAYAVPWLGNTTTLAASDSLLIDSPMFAQASGAGTWAIGTGVPRVAFTALGNTYPTIVDTHDASITLQEVA